ncbi:hypothetical protein [Bradyrhizobium genosp. P]|uniref:hypothetical protein n=1 Tax=Bradyrhizobium genosp. P TaxID=83641 RepID=UPI003CF89ADA
MAMEGAQQSIGKRAAKCRKPRSSLVRRLLSARDDPAKQRIRRWLSEISDERLSRFGLAAEDIALLRNSRGSGDFVKLWLILLSLPSLPGPWF